MLYITIGKDDSIKDVVFQPGGLFDIEYETSWLNNDMAKKIISGIDNSQHIKDHIIISPVFGGISPRDLSTGCKAVLLLLNEPSYVVSGERMGDNCYHWASEVGKLQDINITLNHYLEDRDIAMTAIVLNSGRVIHNSAELNEEVLKVLS